MSKISDGFQELVVKRPAMAVAVIGAILGIVLNRFAPQYKVAVGKELVGLLEPFVAFYALLAVGAAFSSKDKSDSDYYTELLVIFGAGYALKQSLGVEFPPSIYKYIPLIALATVGGAWWRAKLKKIESGEKGEEKDHKETILDRVSDSVVPTTITRREDLIDDYFDLRVYRATIKKIEELIMADFAHHGIVERLKHEANIFAQRRAGTLAPPLARNEEHCEEWFLYQAESLSRIASSLDSIIRKMSEVGKKIEEHLLNATHKIAAYEYDPDALRDTATPAAEEHEKTMNIRTKKLAAGSMYFSVWDVMLATRKGSKKASGKAKSRYGEIGVECNKIREEISRMEDEFERHRRTGMVTPPMHQPDVDGILHRGFHNIRPLRILIGFDQEGKVEKNLKDLYEDISGKKLE